MNPIVSRILQLLPDRLYLDLQYFKNFHKFPNWKNPKTFNEKLQWMKLYDRKPEYTMMVDKYAVKDYVASIIGSEHIIPTLGVWDRPEDIDWNSLPGKFVLKTTHGGGNEGVIICKDKSSFDRTSAVEKLNRCLKRNTYYYGREWPYKNVPRRIIAEQFMEQKVSEKSEALIDYKFYCFDGKPYYCQVIQDRDTEETIDFYDMDWNHMPFVGLKTGVGNSKNFLPKPTALEGMINICQQLSKGLSFARIDLYQIKDVEYFGEITFFPNSGLGTFKPDDWNSIMGSLVKLPVGQNGGGV